MVVAAGACFRGKRGRICPVREGSRSTSYLYQEPLDPTIGLVCTVFSETISCGIVFVYGGLGLLKN